MKRKFTVIAIFIVLASIGTAVFVDLDDLSLFGRSPAEAFVPQSKVLLEETLEQSAFCPFPLFEKAASASHFRILLI